MTPKNIWLKSFLIAIPVGGITSATAAEFTGPSSSQSPYVLPTVPGAVTVSLLTVGDAVNYKADGVTPYRMVGIPDGLGAFDNQDGTFTVLMNQELSGNGIVRDHGLRGAFVSKWIVDKDELTVLHGEDLIKQAYAWDVATGSYVPETRAYSRFCSGDLPKVSAFYDSESGRGYDGRIFMNGEESGTEGRAVAHVLDGNSYELPRLGKMAWENSVANPGTGGKTVVAGTDDGPGNQVYFYVGTKTRGGSPIQRAGLANGVLYGLKVNGFPAEDPATGIPSGTTFTAVNLGDVSAMTGREIDAASVAAGVTSFQRPEDSCWDPEEHDTFYFVTTASFTGNSRLWRLRFKDATNPSKGGRIDMLLNGSEGQRMFDNMTVGKDHNILLQEDVGNNLHLGKIWRYNTETRRLKVVAQHDPERFLPGGSNFLTTDEESSGIIPMTDILGDGWFMFDVQAHYNAGDPELVEGGQLCLIYLSEDN